jgi:hypothetical protein
MYQKAGMPVMSESRVSHESVTSIFWRCCYRAPVGHEGSFFFNQTLRSLSGPLVGEINKYKATFGVCHPLLQDCRASMD